MKNETHRLFRGSARELPSLLQLAAQPKPDVNQIQKKIIERGIGRFQDLGRLGDDDRLPLRMELP